MKRILIGLLIALVAIVLSGMGYEALARHRARRDFPAPGRLVDIGDGRRLQLDCRGAGLPTVVFEAGLDVLGSLAWAAVQDSVAATTRACAYSRPGVMWSSPARAHFDSRRLAEDLHTALVSSGESAPWVMVGHSLGGPYVVTFTSAYATEVAGLVLVDPSSPNQFARFEAIAGKSMAPSSRTVRVGAALGSTGLLRMLPTPATTPWSSAIGRASNAFLPMSLGALAAEVDAVSATLAAEDRSHALGDRPLVVLTSGREAPEAMRAAGLTPEQGQQIRAATRELHEEQAHWSTQGRHELVEDASHYIQFDRPDVVLRAIRDVVSAVRVRRDREYR